MKKSSLCSLIVIVTIAFSSLAFPGEKGGNTGGSDALNMAVGFHHQSGMCMPSLDAYSSCDDGASFLKRSTECTQPRSEADCEFHDKVERFMLSCCGAFGD